MPIFDSKKGTFLRGLMLYIIVSMVCPLSFGPNNSPESNFAQITGSSMEHRSSFRLRFESNYFARASKKRQEYGNQTGFQRRIASIAPGTLGQTQEKARDQPKPLVANAITAVKRSASRLSRHHMIQFNVDNGGGKRLTLIMQWIRAQQVTYRSMHCNNHLSASPILALQMGFDIPIRDAPYLHWSSSNLVHTGIQHFSCNDDRWMWSG